MSAGSYPRCAWPSALGISTVAPLGADHPTANIADATDWPVKHLRRTNESLAFKAPQQVKNRRRR